jgi:MFS transporter, DHA2 family, multidrug resistance protein
MMPTQPEPLHGLKLALAGIVVGLSNFAVILDLTITNVAVPHIAGGLAVSPEQGTWTITSYAVAEAICVPLSGWLANRFGLIRSFMLALLGFGLASLLCGLSQSLEMLVLARVLQGFCGGPIMPMSQSIMVRIFPPDKQPMAMGIWGITTITAPIFGPILGGVISDNLTWHWVFLINVPVIAVSLIAIRQLLPPFETITERVPIDVVGFILLVICVGAYQIMLDTGQTNDWFQSTRTIILAIIAAIGLAAFIIWELTEENPIVDIRIFKYPSFTIATIGFSFAYASFMSAIVLAPLWMQKDLGYSATYSGYAMAFMGMLAVMCAPIAAQLLKKVDLRFMVFAGILWMALAGLLRVDWSIEQGFWTFALPQLLQGPGIPFYFIGLTALAATTIPANKMTSGIGLLSFMRTIAGATATTITVSLWDHEARLSRSEIVSAMSTSASSGMNTAGLPPEQVRAVLDRMVDVHANTLSVNHIFLIGFVLSLLAAIAVLFVPRPKEIVDVSQIH